MRSVLITGACGGMGSAAASLLADKGFRVFALDVNPCRPADNIFPIKADITSEDSLKAAFGQVRGITDSLYAVIHFAGIYMLDSLTEIADSDFRRIIDVNLRGAYLVNKTFLPMLSAGSRILMTTSELAAVDPLPFTGLYAVTKGALDRYAYSLRMELQLLGINVSVLRAGAVKTGMLDVSTEALARFCEETKLYSCNAVRFKRIVAGVEARHISPEVIAKKCAAIIEKRRPRFAYTVNRNPLLILFGLLPAWVQFRVIRMILSN